MFIKVRNYLAPNITTDNIGIQVRGHPAKYVYGCYMTPFREGPSDMYITRKASLKDTLFICMQHGIPLPVLQGRVLCCTFTRCKHPDCLPMLHVRRIYFEGLFMISCVHVTHWLLYQQMKSIRFFNPSSVIYMRAHVNSSTPANIHGLMQTFKFQYSRFQVYFNRFWCIFFIKMSTLNNGIHNELGLYIFHIFIGLNLAYIDYSLCQTQRVYMQYLRCCGHSNECLFLVFSTGWRVAKLVLVSVVVGVVHKGPIWPMEHK